MVEGAGSNKITEQGETEGVLALLGKITGGGIGSRSQFALRTAADAAGTEGIGGVIVIKIPPKCKDYVDVDFTIGVVEVVSRWSA